MEKCCRYFQALWKHLGNFFTSTSGHTEISQYPSNTSFSSWQRETECTAVFISLQLLLKLGQLRPLFSFTFNFRFFLKSVTNASVNEFMKTVQMACSGFEPGWAAVIERWNGADDSIELCQPHFLLVISESCQKGVLIHLQLYLNLGINFRPG